jgi:hypothetical protein
MVQRRDHPTAENIANAAEAEAQRVLCQQELDAHTKRQATNTAGLAAAVKEFNFKEAAAVNFRVLRQQAKDAFEKVFIQTKGPINAASAAASIMEDFEDDQETIELDIELAARKVDTAVKARDYHQGKHSANAHENIDANAPKKKRISSPPPAAVYLTGDEAVLRAMLSIGGNMFTDEDGHKAMSLGKNTFVLANEVLLDSTKRSATKQFTELFPVSELVVDAHKVKLYDGKYTGAGLPRGCNATDFLLELKITLDFINA